MFSCCCCGSKNLIEDKIKGDIICKDCGVIQEPIYTNSVKIFKSNIFEKSYYLFLPYNGLGTFIEFSKQRITKAPQRLKKALWRCKNLKNLSEILIYYAFNYIKQICNIFELPELIIHTSIFIYKKLQKEKFLVGKQIETVALAVIYYACKINKRILELNELSRITEIDAKSIFKTYRQILIKFGNKIEHIDLLNLAYQYLDKINLKLNEKTKMEIIEKIKQIKRNINTPKALIGAVVYQILKKKNQEITLNYIAKLFGVTTMTLKRYYKII